MWNKQLKDEVLLDVDAVALGNVTKLRWNEPGKWIWSEQAVHEPLVDVETFDRAHTVRRARGAADERSPRRTPRPYALRGVLRCKVCGRRMQGSWNNGAAYYRCVFLSQYAAKNKVSHPRSVYLRDDQILPRLDDWLTTKFSPGRLPATVRELEDAQDHTEAPADAGSEAAKREIADCDASLRQHRAALEAGASPEIVAAWINETKAKRAAAEARLRQQPTRCRRMTERRSPAWSKHWET